MTDSANSRELVLDRLLHAPRHSVFRCWTEAELVKQWFAPAPFTVAAATIDARPGGVNAVTMRGPDGQDMPNVGVFLEVVPDERIVFTDAFTAGWKPRDGLPFMAVEINLSDEDGGTRYDVRVRHWTEEAKRQHEAMGFQGGWNICADQLEALAKTL